MLRVVLKFELSLSLAFLFAGCTGLGRAVSPGPQRPANAPRRSTPPLRYLVFMERNLTWPDSKQSSKMRRATASRIRYRSLAPTAAAVWDAVAAL